MGDDWDEGGAVAVKPSGFGRGRGMFGRGRGGNEAMNGEGMSSNFGRGDRNEGFKTAFRSKEENSTSNTGFGRGGFSGRDRNSNDNDSPRGFGSRGGFASKTSESGSRGGFGYGRSSGFGSSIDDNDTGFGSRGRGGFSSRKYDDAGELDSSSGDPGSRRGGGFGSGRFGSSNDSEGSTRAGGFASRSGFGRKFGSSSNDDDDSPRGGGFGERRGTGDRGCYKCGQDGHMARDCPDSSAGRSGGRGCHKCGEEGHFARECPSAQAGRSSAGSSGCFKCGESGHFARECPNSAGIGGGATGDKPREIYVPPTPSEGEEELFRTIEAGINFDSYDKIPIKCTGDNAPTKGISSFSEAGLPETLAENVRRAGYKKPTPVQKMAIPCALNGRDIMACAQTGSGKTAAFLLPVLTGIVRDNLSGGGFGDCSPAAIVIGPTRELIIQIDKECRKFAHKTIVKSCLVYGGTSVQHQSQRLPGSHIVVGTPGRLLDFIERGKISLANVHYLILDEADRMLDMGFKQEIDRLVNNPSLPPKGIRQTLLFSATFPDEVQRMASDYLNSYLFITIGRVGEANTDITQEFHNVDQYGKREKLTSILNETGSDRTLIFVEQKRQADFLASFLSQSDFPTTSIHGDRLQREREEALADFKSGRAPILVATNVAARGLDIPNVKHVVNYDLPGTIDEYVHRIGRTGRCGNLGRATSFYDANKDGELARSLVTVLSNARQDVPSWLEEAANHCIGSGFSGAGGSFGGRDTRKFGGRSNDGGHGGFGGGGFTGSSAGKGFPATSAGDDEEWD